MKRKILVAKAPLKCYTYLLIEEYNDILTQLTEATEKDREGLFHDLVRLIRRILDYQLREEDNLKDG